MVWLQWKELQQAQTMSHTTGRTTFALVKHNLRKKNPDGAEPSRIQMHKVTHTRKDDKIVDEASREIILTIEDIAEADPYLGNLFGTCMDFVLHLYPLMMMQSTTWGLNNYRDV
ncbi:uncharacterized protein LOC122065192 isoform X1 [Macadamia integrifolia]|uniref:uncharacterized protein LOC122065192 isoform X1 n=1 Tax=Macadamia integrifolia TaxID=60698 RepID=UPI001C4EFC27|nr:uncharacterized protein LOC122065192 isoform X1 [Macadamia integrifolia]